jgi:uncharacterized protein
VVRLVRLCLGLQQDAADQDRAVRVFRAADGNSVVANAAIAYRLRPRLGAQVPTSSLVERYREMLESRFVRVMVAVGVIVGLFAGGAASGHVLEYLAWRNSTSFNVTDPRFGLDVGFFVFDYPWWRFVLSFAFAAFVFSAIVAAIVH